MDLTPINVAQNVTVVFSECAERLGYLIAEMRYDGVVHEVFSRITGYRLRDSFSDHEIIDLLDAPAGWIMS